MSVRIDSGDRKPTIGEVLGKLHNHYKAGPNLQTGEFLADVYQITTLGYQNTPEIDQVLKMMGVARREIVGPSVLRVLHSKHLAQDVLGMRGDITAIRMLGLDNLSGVSNLIDVLNKVHHLEEPSPADIIFSLRKSLQAPQHETEKKRRQREAQLVELKQRLAQSLGYPKDFLLENLDAIETKNELQMPTLDLEGMFQAHVVPRRVYQRNLRLIKAMYVHSPQPIQAAVKRIGQVMTFPAGNRRWDEVRADFVWSQRNNIPGTKVDSLGYYYNQDKGLLETLITNPKSSFKVINEAFSRLAHSRQRLYLSRQALFDYQQKAAQNAQVKINFKGRITNAYEEIIVLEETSYSEMGYLKAKDWPPSLAGVKTKIEGNQAAALIVKALDSFSALVPEDRNIKYGTTESDQMWRQEQRISRQLFDVPSELLRKITACYPLHVQRLVWAALILRRSTPPDINSYGVYSDAIYDAMIWGKYHQPKTS